MENLNLSKEEKDLQKGEAICSSCGKGKMKPLNPEAGYNHCFACDNCGANLMITPGEPVIE